MHCSYRIKLIVIFVVTGVCLWLSGCEQEPEAAPQEQIPQQAVVTEQGDPNWPHPRSDELIDERQRMVRHIRYVYGLDDTAALEALENVPPKSALGL